MPELNAPQRPITSRSVTLGLLGVILICGLTPYNDYALNNTFLVGNNLPLGVVMLTFLITVCINGPISRWTPRHALSTGEVAVAFSMMLVSCAIPSSGLMRYLPGILTGPFFYGRDNSEFKELLASLHVPAWLFPAYSGKTMLDWMNDPIIEGFQERWTGSGSFPYSAWIRPMVVWGVFTFALYGALLCMVTIIRRQWLENERLAFPLAQIQLALVEQPARGKLLNSWMRNRAFWIAAGAVFLLHAYNGLSNYFPRNIARIPVWYSIHDLLSEPPWQFAAMKIKDAAIFFSAVGVTYFVSGSVAFSLWFFYILANLYRMWLGTYTGDPDNAPQQFSQHFGGIIAYALMIFWIGRKHFRMVISQAFRGARAGEPRDPYLPYPLAFWGFVACSIVMIGWMMLAGCTLAGAVVMVLLLLLLFLIITRIIGETGLIHGQLQVSIVKPWWLMILAGSSRPVPLETHFVGSMVNAVHYDYREVVPVYASHALKVADGTSAKSAGWKLIALLGIALLVGYVVSFGSMLWTEYTYAFTQDIAAKHPINDWGARDNPRVQVLQTNVDYSKGVYRTNHNVGGHVTFGFVFTSLLGYLRLRFTWWPLHPVGYLMLMTYPSEHLWLSILIGWAARGLIIRFGGARLYTDAKPFFLGLIVGESGAAGMWLIVGIILSALGIPYRPVNIMPG